MQQMQMLRHAQMQRGNPNHPSLGAPMNGIGSEAILGQANASQVAAKMYEERMKQPNQMNTETSQPHMDARMALLKSGANHHGYKLSQLRFCSHISGPHTVRHFIFSVLKQSNGPGKSSRRCFSSIAATSITKSAGPCN